jgi:hypothetical protein
MKSHPRESAAARSNIVGYTLYIKQRRGAFEFSTWTKPRIQPCTVLRISQRKKGKHQAHIKAWHDGHFNGCGNSHLTSAASYTCVRRKIKSIPRRLQRVNHATNLNMKWWAAITLKIRHTRTILESTILENPWISDEAMENKEIFYAEFTVIPTILVTSINKTFTSR